MATARRPASPALPRGRHALSGDEVSAAHRARLHEAVVKLLGTQGYGGTSVDELAAAAGVSTATLYGLFAGKQELVLDAFDAIVADAAGRLRNRPVVEGGLRQALAGVLAAVVDVVLRQSDAARLAVVDIPALGPAGIQRRRALADGLQELLRRAATTADGLTVLSEPALGVLAGGTLQVLDRHLRSGRLRPLRSAALDLAAWGAAYETDAPQRLPARSPFAVAAPPRAAELAPSTQGLPHGRHGLPAAFVARHQRERILEAVLTLSAQQGFEVTSARELATRAGLSRQTFYQHYATKEEAWSAAFDQAFLELFATAWHAGAAQKTAEGKVTAAVTACLAQLIAEPAWARLLLVDAASAGGASSAAIDRSIVAFARLIAGAAGKRELPAIVPLAMVGGIVNLVGGWIVEDRASELTELTPALVEVLFVPLFGAGAARSAQRRLAASADTGVAPADDELRLMDAFARAVVAGGLAATQLAEIAQREEISLETVNALFDDELDCATQALDVWTGQLVAAAAGAYLSAALDRPLAAHRALEAALTHVAHTPALSALAVVDDPEIVKIVAGLRARYATLFLELIGGQLPVADPRAPDAASVLEVVLEGILAVVARYAEEERLAELPDELEALSLQSLTPFFGEAAAQRVAEQSAALR